jgi:hypothetical protein
VDALLSWIDGENLGYKIIQVVPDTVNMFRDEDAFTRRCVMTFSATVVKI